MKIILKSMISLLVLSQLSMGAPNEIEEDMRVLALQGAVRQGENAELDEVRRQIEAVIAQSGAAKRKIEAIQRIFVDRNIPFPEGADRQELILLIAQGRQGIRNVFEALGVAPEAERIAALPLADEELRGREVAAPVVPFEPVNQMGGPLVDVGTVDADREEDRAGPFMINPRHEVLPHDEAQEENPQGTANPPVLALVWFQPQEQDAGVVEQRLALVSAQQTILENAEILGRRKEVEARMDRATVALREADDFYQTLIAMVGIMKKDLRVFSGTPENDALKAWSVANNEKAAEEYVDGLVQYLKKNPRVSFAAGRGEDPRAQISQLQALLAQARESVGVARGELEGINRDMLALQ